MEATLAHVVVEAPGSMVGQAVVKSACVTEASGSDLKTMPVPGHK